MQHLVIFGLKVNNEAIFTNVLNITEFFMLFVAETKTLFFYRFVGQ